MHLSIEAVIIATRRRLFRLFLPRIGMPLYAYCVTGFAGRCVERYFELASLSESSPRRYATPRIDDPDLEPHLFEEKVAVAARVVLKCCF